MFFNTILKIVTSTLFITTTIFSHTIFAAQLLPEFSTRYGVEKYGIKVAEAHYQLSHTKSGYTFSQNTKLHGLASMFGNDSVSAISFIDKVGDRLLLTKHKYTQTGREKNRDEEFEILWHTDKDALNGKITGLVRGEKIILQTQSEVWEALSFQIPLMIDANINIKEYPYKAILKGKIDTYNFILKSTKEVSYAGNSYKALQMVRTDPHKNRQLHIWLLPDLNNIPIMIETYRKGKLDTHMQLESLQFSNANPLIATTDEDDEF